MTHEPFPRANDAVATDRFATGVLLKAFADRYTLRHGVSAVLGRLVVEQRRVVY